MFDIERLTVVVPDDTLQLANNHATCYGQSLDTYVSRAISVKQYLGSFGVSDTIELCYKSHIQPVRLPAVNESDADLKPLNIAMPKRTYDLLTSAASSSDMTIDAYVSHSLDIYDSLHAYYGINEANVIIQGTSHIIGLRPGLTTGLALVD